MAIAPKRMHRRKDDMMKKRNDRYSKDLPRKLYTFFIGYSDVGAPSFMKFARSIGVTLSDIERYREHCEFDRAYRECSEIRRDYLIDNGLTKRFDSSFTKFLLSAEYRMGEEKMTDEERNIAVTLEVIGNEN